MRLKSRKIWYALLLLGIVGAAAIAIWYFDLGPPSKISEKAVGQAKVEKKVITPDDVDREGKRSWVLMYKISEYECKNNPLR